MPAVDGAHGWAGPHGDWSLAGSFGGYAGWDGAWGLHNYGGSSWGLWHTGYVGLPGAYGADHIVDIEGALSGYRADVAAVQTHSDETEQKLAADKDETRLEINPATGAVVLGDSPQILFNFAEDVLAHIDRTGGGDANWQGRQVRLLVESLEPAAAAFVNRYFRFQLGGDGADETVASLDEAARRGVPYVDDTPGFGRDDYHFQVVLEIPAEWNNHQVAQYILHDVLTAAGPIGDLFGRHLAATDDVGSGPGAEHARLFEKWQDERTLEALQEASGYAKLYIETLATLTTGGSAVMAVHNVLEGDLSSAFWEAVFLGPIPSVAGKTGASIAFKAGDAVVANIPAAAIAAMQKLPDADILQFHKLLQNIPAGDSLKKVTEFLASKRIFLLGSTALDPARIKSAVKRLDVFKDVKHLDASTLKSLGTKWAGDQGEKIVRTLLTEAGYKNIFVVKNASNHGLDVVAKLADGRYAVFEVKTSAIGKPGTWSARQANMKDFIDDVTSRAASRTGHYKHLDEATRERAQDLLDELRSAPHNISGNLIQIDLLNHTIVIRPWL